MLEISSSCELRPDLPNVRNDCFPFGRIIVELHAVPIVVVVSAGRGVREGEESEGDLGRE